MILIFEIMMSSGRSSLLTRVTPSLVFGTIWNYFGQFGTILGHLREPKTIWDHLESVGIIWTISDSFGPFLNAHLFRANTIRFLNKTLSTQHLTPQNDPKNDPPKCPITKLKTVLKPKSLDIWSEWKLNFSLQNWCKQISNADTSTPRTDNPSKIWLRGRAEYQL